MLENSGAGGKYRDFVVIAGCYYPNGCSNGAEKLKETATLKTRHVSSYLGTTLLTKIFLRMTLFDDVKEYYMSYSLDFAVTFTYSRLMSQALNR